MGGWILAEKKGERKVVSKGARHFVECAYARIAAFRICLLNFVHNNSVDHCLHLVNGDQCVGRAKALTPDYDIR